MGLTKLLAVGRSVRSVTGQPPRYKMTQQNLLPTFGGPKGAEAHAVEDASPAAEATQKMAPADPPATPVAAEKENAARKSESGPAKAAAFLEATKKLRPFSGGSWFKNPFVRTTPHKKESRPVQTELSLDSVKPVRNDLSDSDAELGRSGRAVQAETPKAPMAVPAPPVAASGGLWQRVKTRWFGANDAN